MFFSYFSISRWDFVTYNEENTKYDFSFFHSSHSDRIDSYGTTLGGNAIFTVLYTVFDIDSFEKSVLFDRIAIIIEFIILFFVINHSLKEFLPEKKSKRSSALLITLFFFSIPYVLVVFWKLSLVYITAYLLFIIAAHFFIRFHYSRDYHQFVLSLLFQILAAMTRPEFILFFMILLFFSVVIILCTTRNLTGFRNMFRKEILIPFLVLSSFELFMFIGTFHSRIGNSMTTLFHGETTKLFLSTFFGYLCQAPVFALFIILAVVIVILYPNFKNLLCSSYIITLFLLYLSDKEIADWILFFFYASFAFVLILVDAFRSGNKYITQMLVIFFALQIIFSGIYSATGIRTAFIEGSTFSRDSFEIEKKFLMEIKENVTDGIIISKSPVLYDSYFFMGQGISCMITLNSPLS